MPGRATSRWWKEEREGVFIDYNQNARDRTVASAYSVRAVPDARVSCPLSWEEVPDVEPAELRLRHRARAPARARRPVRGDRRARRAAGRRCWSSPRATSARASATRPGRRTFASRRASRRACSPAARARRRHERLPLAPPVKPQLALSRKELPERRAVRLRGQARRLSLPGVRRRRGRVPAVAQRQAARALLPRARAAAPAATCSTARSSCATPTVARTSTRSASASIRPPRASSACRSRRPPCTSPSICSRASDESLLERPFVERRAALEELLAGERVRRRARRADGVHGRHRARRARGSSAAEGAIAKERAAPYRPGERKGMVKVKRVRTIDAVVAGWRPGKEPDTVGALILGLYDGDELRVVGHCSGLRASEKRRLVGFLAAYETGERGTADPSRWSAGKRPRVGRAAPRAGRRDRLRPRLRRAHPPRREAAALARGQGRRECTFDQLSSWRPPRRGDEQQPPWARQPADRDRRRGGVPADPLLAAGGRPADDRREHRARDAAVGADRARDGRAPGARRLHHARRATARSRSPRAAPSTPSRSFAATA